jgi:hypothetical protein
MQLYDTLDEVEADTHCVAGASIVSIVIGHA